MHFSTLARVVEDLGHDLAGFDVELGDYRGGVGRGEEVEYGVSTLYGYCGGCWSNSSKLDVRETISDVLTKYVEQNHLAGDILRL